MVKTTVTMGKIDSLKDMVKTTITMGKIDSLKL